MIDFNRGNYETADGRSDLPNGLTPLPFSRVVFLAEYIIFRSVVASAKLPRAAGGGIGMAPCISNTVLSIRLCVGDKDREGRTQTISYHLRRDFRRFATVIPGWQRRALMIAGFISVCRARLPMGAL